MATFVLNIDNIDTLGESLLAGKVAAADFASQLSDSAFVEETRLANKPAETIETNSDAAIEFVVKFAPDVANNDLAFKTFLTANQIDSTEVLLAPSQADSKLLAPAVALKFVPILHPLNIIIGTAGNNILFGTNTTRDIIFGLDGNDLLFGQGKNDFLFGGNGNDILIGGIGNDLLFGENGNDILFNDAGSDTLFGGAGNDSFFVLDPSGSSQINGETGIDTANYSGLGQTIVLGITGTVTKAGGGIDQLNGIEIITASTLKGDTIDASAATGSTSITANLAINSLIVNNVPGLGTLNFTVNNFENVTGTANNDTIIGNAGYNILRGGAGVDFLVGDAGNDTLIGGSGVDVLVGGTGNDQFSFSNPAEGLDFITDFVSGSDKIVVSASGFGGGLTQGLLSAGKFFVGAAATIGTHRFIYNNFTGGLFFDVDGNGAAVQQQIATLTPFPNTFPTLTFSDIQVIA